MPVFHGCTPIPASALAPLLRAARLRSWAWLLGLVLAGAGVVHVPTGAGGPPEGAAAGFASKAPHGGVSRLAERDARALLAPDGASLRVLLRRGDAPVRDGLRGPDPSRRPVSLRALPPPAGGFQLSLPLSPAGPVTRALAAARDGTLSSASNGVPPPSLA